MDRIKVFQFQVKSFFRNTVGIGFLVLLLSILAWMLFTIVSGNNRSELIYKNAVALKSTGLSGFRGELQGYYLVSSKLDNSEIVEARSTSFVSKGESICLREQYDPKKRTSIFTVLSFGKCPL